MLHRDVIKRGKHTICKPKLYKCIFRYSFSNATSTTTGGRFHIILFLANSWIYQSFGDRWSNVSSFNHQDFIEGIKPDILSIIDWFIERKSNIGILFVTLSFVTPLDIIFILELATIKLGIWIRCITTFLAIWIFDSQRTSIKSDIYTQLVTKLFVNRKQRILKVSFIIELLHYLYQIIELPMICLLLIFLC